VKGTLAIAPIWTFFLASGLAFAFLERREEVGQESLAKIQASLRNDRNYRV